MHFALNFFFGDGGGVLGMGGGIDKVYYKINVQINTLLSLIEIVCVSMSVSRDKETAVSLDQVNLQSL